MTKEIEKIYLDFFEYYETVKEKLEVIYNNCEYVDSLFEGIITSLKYYYDNKSEIILSDDVIDYFEHEDFLNSIINKIKYTIEFLDLVYYKILNEDVNLFNNYIIVVYYISILEDLLMFVESKNMDSTWVEDELKELNDILYNKVEITESYSEYISNKITEISKTYDGFYPSIIIFKIVKTLISDHTPNKEEFIEGAIQDFLNNMGSYEELFKLIEKEAHTSGLTDRIKNRLCLLIDGELPEEENEEMEENFDDAFKKPELQDFREEAERELADEKAQNEEDFDDLDEDIDESEDDFDEDIDESEDDFDEDIDESEDDFEDVDESEDDFDEDIDESEDDFEDESEEDDEEDIDESEEEIVEDEDESDEEIIEEDEAESEEEIVEEDEAESEDEAVDDESEETVDEESEESESADLEEEEEKPKESKFLDTFKHIKEQEKKNKSSFDLSRRNRKSPTLNISSNK